MTELDEYIDLDTFLKLRPLKVGKFCEGVLDADILAAELDHSGPFAPLRKRFCEFLGIGESTLTGWFKDGRVPRAAKVAYVLLVGMTRLQAEVERLRREVHDQKHDLKIVQDGKSFQVVRFEIDETGIWIGEIVARDIPNAKTARVLAGSLRAFRMLQETRPVIDQMMERMEFDNKEYFDDLRELNTRIIEETLAAFEPDKWRELFGPINSDLGIEERLDEIDRQVKSRETVEPNTALESASNSGGQDDARASRKRE